MAKGYWGRILRVDLSTKKISVDEHGEKFYRTYLGGKGIIAHYLMKEVPPGCDPLGPDNVLVFAASVLTGTGIPGAARNSAGAKSPLTGGYGEGEHHRSPGFHPCEHHHELGQLVLQHQLFRGW